jgi:hypothetical protein
MGCQPARDVPGLSAADLIEAVERVGRTWCAAHADFAAVLAAVIGCRSSVSTCSNQQARH